MIRDHKVDSPYKDINTIENEQLKVRLATYYNFEYMDKLACHMLDFCKTFPKISIGVDTVDHPEKIKMFISTLKEFDESETRLHYELNGSDSEIFVINRECVAIRLFFHSHYESRGLKEIIKSLENEEYGKIHCTIQFDQDYIRNETLAKHINENFVGSHVIAKEAHTKKIGMFQKNPNGQLVVNYSPVQDAKDELNLEDLYNDEFEQVHENIMLHLTEKDHGLILLHGKPGTGKTSYIRYLIRQDFKKNIIYMPPFMTQMLGSPEFMSFLMNNKNNIYIIEDAETALKTREAGGNEAVANILNASDGIMGDVIKSQFIFTFNCQSDEIDSALKRPGRLLEQYEFEKLNEEKTENLWKKINGNIEQPKPRMNLAEIFNHNTTINTQQKEEDSKEGFGFMKTG